MTKYNMYVGDGEPCEVVLIYGVNQGDSDEVGEAIKAEIDAYYDDLINVTLENKVLTEEQKTKKIESYNSKKLTTKGWFVSNGANVITEDYWNGIFVNKPSLNYLWPIWKTFIDKSNNMLNNDGNYGQL